MFACPVTVAAAAAAQLALARPLLVLVAACEDLFAAAAAACVAACPPSPARSHPQRAPVAAPWSQTSAAWSLRCTSASRVAATAVCAGRARFSARVGVSFAARGAGQGPCRLARRAKPGASCIAARSRLTAEHLCAAQGVSTRLCISWV